MERKVSTVHVIPQGAGHYVIHIEGPGDPPFIKEDQPWYSEEAERRGCEWEALPEAEKERQRQEILRKLGIDKQ